MKSVKAPFKDLELSDAALVREFLGLPDGYFRALEENLQPTIREELQEKRKQKKNKAIE